MTANFSKILAFIVLSITLYSAEAYSGTVNIDSLQHTPLNLKLVSTLISEDGTSRAVLKNPATDEIKGFSIGQNVELLKDKDIRILGIVPCTVVLQINGLIEKLECEKSKTDVSQSLAHLSRSSLDNYEIVSPRFLLLKKKYSSQFDEEIVRACTRFDVDPQLVKALIKAESNFDQFAVSPKNAEGLMQLMPATAKEYGVNNSFSPRQNIEGGVKFFRHLLDHFNNDLHLSIAAYNAGKQSVIKYGNKIPPYPETQQFVKRVLHFYDELSIN